MGTSRTDSVKAMVGSFSDTFALPRSKRHKLWLIIAALLVFAGTVGGIFAARSVAADEAEKSHQAFLSSSAEIASTLQLSLQHEDDLVVSAGGFFAGNPNATNAQFSQWAASVHALERYPELTGFGHSVIVPAADLPAFAAHAVLDPSGPLAPDGTFQVIPPGDRPYYCLSAVSLVWNQASAIPAGVDFCANNPDATDDRDSGQGSYLPLKIGGSETLGIETPLYRDGVVPATVQARRDAFLGLLGTTVLPKVVLDRALHGHPHTAVTFRFHKGASDVVFSSGTAAAGAQSVTTPLQDGWTVQTFGTVLSGTILASRSALALLTATIMVSLLLAALVFVLGTGRERALRLVGEKTDELRHQALHDALTGLPNRALIMDRLTQLLARNRRYGTHAAAMFVDLDEFKNVNDTLGHEAGDRLLVAVAARMQSTLRDADTIGRMGGDEFVVLLDGASVEAAPELVAQRLLEVMRQPFELDGASLPLIVNISIGIATGDRRASGDLLRDADVALYQAKAAGKNRYELFQPAMQTEISHRIELEFDLRSALQAKQFHLVYQPIYNLEKLTLVGVEALLRWAHPVRGIIGPDEFIPILEQSGQIREVGRWVLQQACAQMAAWQASGYSLDLSVNVSGRQLDDDAIVGYIRDALVETGLPATALIIEVTETALMRNADATARRLTLIKQLGVRIAVDDFGTGYSSLAYLQQFPVDCLKIDRAFTNAITRSPESRALIRTLVQLGNDLGLCTLAEGVETAAEMDQLRGEHVQEAQGFLLARPLDPDALERQFLAPTRAAHRAA